MAMWRLRLLGRLRGERGRQVLERFPSRAVALLLARLALPPQRRHAREELIELLWPEVAPEIGRNRLRQALSTLRRLIEPPDIPPQSVLQADRQSIALHPEGVETDVAAFEQALRIGDIDGALSLYGGDLLPAYLDEWVNDERLRLSALYERAALRKRPDPAGGGLAHAAAARHEEPQLLAYPSTFYGREREIAKVLDAIVQHRLVTLTALGGFGKTRLATESAGRAEGFEAVAFVALADCGSSAEFEQAICNALGMPAKDGDARAQLLAFLVDRRVLLVLDNFEHLDDRAASTLLQLLMKLPELHVIVTSRRALDLPGEQTIALGPLPVPIPGLALGPAAATPSVALFVDRARGARPDFALTEANRETLIALARKLEGLPLAIEIAASRIRSYAPEDMLAALDARFSLLRRPGSRGARYGRHASLEVAIEWSWNLLSSQERELFASLVVLRGTWTADTAAEVLVLKPAQVRAALYEFVAASLLCVETDGRGVPRFSMLETLREFAASHLEAGRDALLRQRHLGVFLRRAEDCAAARERVDEAEWPNYRAAGTFALARRAPELALKLALSLRSRWEAKGVSPEELEWIGAAVEGATEERELASAGQEMLAQIRLAAGDLTRATEHAEQAVALASSSAASKARALLSLAQALWEREPQSPRLALALAEATKLAADTGDRLLEGDALRVRGKIVLMHGSENADHAGADILFQRAEALYRAAGAADWAERARLSRVACLSNLRRESEAENVLDACEAYFASSNSAVDLVAVANMRGYLESGRGNWAQALAAGRVCLRLAWAHHARQQLTLALWNLPQALLHVGAVRGAARLMGFAAASWERNIGPLTAADRENIEEVALRVRAECGPRETARHFAEGARMSLATAVSFALSTAE